MNLVICDDDALFLKKLNDQLLTFPKVDRLNIHIFQFTSGSDLLLWYIQKNHDIDLLFIDIEMPGYNGLEVIKHLRKSKCHCQIVVISSYKEYVFQSLDYEISHYLVKPFDDYKIESVTNLAIEKFMLSRKAIEIYDGPEHIVLLVKNIIFIESNLFNLTFYTTRGPFYTKGRIRNYQKLLQPYHFLRTHKSYLVNMSFILGYKHHIFKLSGGYEIEISHTNRAAIIEHYNAFLRQHLVR